MSGAAQQVEPEEPPPPPDIAEVRFELDDYRIEGFITMSPGAPACAAGDLPCMRDAARAEQPDPEAAEAPSPEAPPTPGS